MKRALPARRRPGDRYVLSADRSIGQGQELLGGKAAHLARLCAAGLPVPPWFVITTAAFDGPTGEVDARVAVEIGIAIANSFSAGALLAVRSSMSGEDSAGSSFAGQMETFLCVCVGDALARIADVAASAHSRHALEYLALRGVDPRSVKAGVVVQEMIHSNRAGVLFTSNPTSGDSGEAVIVAGFGLGEGIVASSVEGDTYYVDSSSGMLRRSEIVEKRTRLVLDENTGTGITSEDVPSDRRGQPCLSPTEIVALIEIAKQVVALDGLPQDIEWAIDDSGKIWLLQARPITALESAPLPGTRAGTRADEKIYDNANIVENYPGLTMPLTFSFVKPAYEAVFRSAAHSLGVPSRVINANRDVYANLVVLVDGRLYYDILNWYELFRVVPGFEWMLPGWERALGLDAVNVATPVSPRVLPGIRIALARARIGTAILRSTLRLNKETAGYLAELSSQQERFSYEALGNQSAQSILTNIERLQDKMWGPYGVSVVNDLILQQSVELVRRLVGRWRVGDPAALTNALVRASGDVEAVELLGSLRRLASIAAKDPGLAAHVFGKSEENAVWRHISGSTDWEEFRLAADEYINRYGDRAIGELKLETLAASDEPWRLIGLIRIVGASPAGANSHSAAESQSKAEQQVARSLRVHPLRRALFRIVLSRARHSVRNREDLRLARTRGYAMVRRAYRSIGTTLAADGFIERRDDVFWITSDEIAGAVRGATTRFALDDLISARRDQASIDNALDPPSRVTVRGGIRITPDTSMLVHPGTSVLGVDEVLSGTPCSPGRIVGTVRVVLDPSKAETMPGEILVALTTDPGWIFLMAVAGGLITERGSLLSHTAIVGRELGVPTVVAVEGATSLLKTGDLVELDGAAGTVRRL